VSADLVRRAAAKLRDNPESLTPFVAPALVLLFTAKAAELDAYAQAIQAHISHRDLVVAVARQVLGEDE
jgi:hypothetical protein